MGSKNERDIQPHFKIRARTDKTIYSKLHKDRDRTIVSFPDAQVGAISPLLYWVLFVCLFLFKVTQVIQLYNHNLTVTQP